MPVPISRGHARLTFEELEDRSTPSGSQIPAGEFNWTQVSPGGSLTQLIWDGSTLVYRTRSGSHWIAENVAVENGTFTRDSYDDQRQLEAASQTAQLVYTNDGTPHALYLAQEWIESANGYQTQIVHMARTAGVWSRVETITVPWVAVWGPNNLVAAAGPDNSISLVFAESYSPAVTAGNQGTGILWYTSNSSGTWTYEKIAETADLRQDNWFVGDRVAPRWLSLAVDSDGAAHITYTPGFLVKGSFSAAYSELRYATNASGSWQSTLVYAPPDGTGDAALGASIAIGLDGEVAIAGYFVDRYETGSAKSARLQYYTPTDDGGWEVEVVASLPGGYAAGDGAKFTGFAPQLFFDTSGRANIVFTDVAGQHLPESYGNTYAGQIRMATLSSGVWVLSTVASQSSPLSNGMFYPVAVTYQGKLVFAGLKSASVLDGDRNVVQMNFSWTEVNAPTDPPPPPPPPRPSRPQGPPGPPGRHRPSRQPDRGRPGGRPSQSPSPPAVPPAPAPLPKPPAPTSPPPPASEPVLAGPPATEEDLVDDTLHGQPPPVSPPPPPPKPEALIAIATEAGVSPAVSLYSEENVFLGTIFPFDETYLGGLRLVTADVNNDGQMDLIVGSGAGDPSWLQIWDGKTHTLMFDVDPFEGFTGGLFVAAGDFDADGYADVVVVPESGGGPRVQTWSGKTLTRLTADFFSVDYAGLTTGLRVAVGDIDKDGYDDLAIVPGPGGGSRVSVFDGSTFTESGEPERLMPDFFLKDVGEGNGVKLTIDDRDGDGSPEIFAVMERAAGRRGQSSPAPRPAPATAVVINYYGRPGTIAEESRTAPAHAEGAHRTTQGHSDSGAPATSSLTFDSVGYLAHPGEVEPVEREGEAPANIDSTPEPGMLEPMADPVAPSGDFGVESVTTFSTVALIGEGCDAEVGKEAAHAEAPVAPEIKGGLTSYGLAFSLVLGYVGLSLARRGRRLAEGSFVNME